MPAAQSQDKLGTMPIGRLLAVMSIPMMISMFVQALYNLVDSMFVARLSEDALTAVALAFPVQNIIVAISVGTSVGLNALVSRSLGSGDRETAEKAANVQFFLAVVYWLLFALLGIFFTRRFYLSQTGETAIVGYGVEYLSIVCLLSGGSFFGQNLEKLLLSTGNSAESMISQITGAVINLIFDPLLIFGLGPFPALGAQGAAIATVFGQFVAAGVAFVFNLKKNRATRFHLKKILPTAAILGRIYAVGFPSMITVGLSSAMSFCMNQILLGFSTTATSVFGIWLRLQNFGLMPVYGMNNGTLSIYSYNHGARKFHRVRGTMRLAFILGAVVSLSVMALYELLTPQLLALFSASENMLSIGLPGLRLCSLSLPFAGCCVVLSSSYQALGRSRFTLLLNVCRQLALQVSAA